MRAVSQDRVAEDAWSERLQITVVLLAYRVRSLIKDKNLIFKGCLGEISHLSSAFDHFGKHTPAAGVLVPVLKAAQDKGSVLFTGKQTHGVQIKSNGSVAVACLPGGNRAIVVEFVWTVAPQDDVAKPEIGRASCR